MISAPAGPILLVGAGRMGGALLRGWLARGIEPSRICIQEPALEPEMMALIREHGIAVGVPSLPADGLAVLLLAVKPQVMDEVAPLVAPMAGPDTLVISVAAGRTIDGLARHFAEETAIVRAMPNTPAAIGRGITALFANSWTNSAQRQLCADLLGAAGETVWLSDEGEMGAVTAVSGSGPAYVFLLAEALARAGEDAGLPPDLAARLARATVAGAGELLHRSDTPPADLRRGVTSPGGTTAAALAVLMGDDAGEEAGPLQDLLSRAVDAAARRSRELAG